MVNLDVTDEFHTCNINKVKGDIFEHITKYYYLSKGYETYLFHEIPFVFRVQLPWNTRVLFVVVTVPLIVVEPELSEVTFAFPAVMLLSVVLASVDEPETNKFPEVVRPDVFVVVALVVVRFAAVVFPLIIFAAIILGAAIYYAPKTNV